MSQPRALLFELLSGRTAWLTQRQAVLTHNVANADTPDFAAMDLKPAGFTELLRHRGGSGRLLAMVRTEARHLAPAARDAGSFRAGEVDSYEVAPSGNAVVIPEQLQKMAKTELDFQLTTSLYRRYATMLRSALGTPQG